PSTAQAPGLTSVATVSTVLPAVTLLGPLLVLGALSLTVSRRAPGVPRSEVAPPLFHVAAADMAARSWAVVRSANVPAQYRSLFNARALESAVATGRPVVWLIAVLALCIAVT